MIKLNLHLSIFILAGLFTFQTLDIPSVRHGVNSKTCCGRSVCLCKHPKGSVCSFRAMKERKEKIVPDTSAGSQHQHCHSRPAGKETSKELKKNPAREGLLFAKTPCASDTSKTLLPSYAKDSIFPEFSFSFDLSSFRFIRTPTDDVTLPLRGLDIERPPRIPSFSF